MSQVASPPPDRPGTRDVVALTETSIRAFRRGEIGALVAPIPVPTDLATILDACPPAKLPKARLACRAGDVRPVVVDGLSGDHGVGDADRQAMVQAIAYLAARASALMIRVHPAPAVAIRVDVIADDACRLFHADAVVCRLTCTLRGPGTQVVPRVHAADALRRQRDYTGPIWKADRFDAVIAAGSRLPGGIGTLHRSPPIEGTGTTRLLLAIDPLSDEIWADAGRR